MISLVAILIVSSPLGAPGDTAVGFDQVFDPIAARDLHATPGEPQSLSKREEWLRDKVLRTDLHVSDQALAGAQRAATAAARDAARRRGRGNNATAMVPPPFPGIRIEPITTLFNIWTREALPVLPGDPLEGTIHSFLRDHYTNQATQMDTRLIGVLTRAARKFSATRIEIVSGYRSPKYNLMLRKKGHQVARSSQHVEGHAVDFRIRGVPTRSLLSFVRSLRLGGVGFYPHSQFVHSDTGRIRYWTGS
jgi:Bacterial protein of unknown function (DUF882)